MKTFITCIMIFFSVFIQAEDQRFSFSDPAQIERFRELTEELRCLVCQNQSLADSDAPLANDLRKRVFGLMSNGKSDDQIIEELVKVYGEFVLYRPRMTPQNYLLWFAPVLLVLIGIIIVVVMIRRRSELVQVSQTDLEKAKQLLEEEQ